MSHLVVKEAWAADNGWTERAEVARDAQRAFIEDHLGRWLPSFCRELAVLDDVDRFYGAAACLCDAFLAGEFEATGARPQPALPRAPGASDGPFTCVYAAPEEGLEEGVL
jgi:TorA maturation chaperone TorD